MADDRCRPSPDAPCLPPNQSSHTSPVHTSPSITSHFSRCLPHSPRPQDSLNQNNRRLARRNAAFTGPTLPARRMTPFGFTPTQEPFTFAAPTNDENSSRTADRRTIHGEEPSPSPINILREISNTSHRKHQSSRPSLASVFQDAIATNQAEELHASSWYHENSNGTSPSRHTASSLRMRKLREGSLNEKTAPTISTPVGKQAKGRNRSRAKSRVSSNEAAKHMEALEAEIVSLNTQLETTKTKAHSAKLRALQTKLREQEDAVTEWEQKFEERVEDVRYEHTRIEQGLQTRIRALEEDCELKEVRIKEVEWELQTERAKVKELESRCQYLERKVDDLTGVLARSPTRLDFASITSTPGSGDPTKRTPRPISLLPPRMQSSPASARHSASFADAILWHSRNRDSISSLSISENPEDDLSSPVNNQQSTSILSEPSTRPLSMLSAPEQLESSQPATFRSSRPTSMISNCSFSASWGMPVPNGSSERSQSVGRSRKMRRFPSGQCSLKPLILPVAAEITPSLPASAPATSNHTTPLRDMSRSSRFSIDPTTAFLSKAIDDNSPFTTPTQRPRRRSASLARRQTLDALEGRSRYAVYEVDRNSRQRADNAEDSALKETGQMGCTPSPCVLRTQRRSLQLELEQAEEAEKSSLERGPTATDTPGALDPDTRTQAFHSPPQPDSAYAPVQPQQPSDDGLRLRRLVSNSSDTPRPPKTTTSPLTTPSKPLPTPSAIIPGTVPLLARFSDLVPSINSHPLALAKRVITNACVATHGSSNSNVGRFGWWLLGLLLGFRHRNETAKGADARLDEEESTILNPERRFDWHTYSAEASKVRRAQALWRDLKYRVSPTLASVNAGVEMDLRRRRPDDRGGTADGEFGISQVGEGQAIPTDVGGAHRYEEGDMAHSYRCSECIEPPSHRSLRLWVRFSVAMLLAFRVAVKDGPGALLVDIPKGLPLSISPPDDRRSGQGGKRFLRDSQETMVASPIGMEAMEGGMLMGPGDGVGETSEIKTVNERHWGWEVAFAETLGRKDFEGKESTMA